MTATKMFRGLGLTLMAAAMMSCAKTEGRTTSDSTTPVAKTDAACPGDNGGLTLPPGFCATVFADDIGHARHAVVDSAGTVYVNTWSGSYYSGPLHAGGFIVALRDTNNDGKAEIVQRFGAVAPKGSGGTGIAIYNGHLYVEEGSSIVRYALSAGSPIPAGTAEAVVTGLPLGGDHPMHPFAIDASGSIYIDLGTATNSCQAGNRLLESPGHQPCTELLTRGGIWRYDANKTNQSFSPAGRYATGIRNAVGIAIGPNGELYSTQHGRDQLYENWPKLYTAEQGQNLPAEELLRIEKGADYGWPMCYFDNVQQKLVLAPEYGGDGGKKLGDCASKTNPIAFFPAHWAPDGLMFYSGKIFPARYQGGAFIAFHGSWNRAPGPQGGYVVAFVPFTGGNPSSSSTYEKFADGFSGGKMSPDGAAHRPVGIAQALDGSIYVTDDKAGRVWRITYTGGSR
jgi:glucose/arabinose dehydrogenase